jgi:hypothetical protein
MQRNLARARRLASPQVMNVRELAEGKTEQERRPSEPAPLPLHALLALQQSAGNQAVGRALARQVVKTPRRKTLVTGSKGGKREGDARLLYIYNQLRAEMSVVPAVFTDVEDAVDQLTTDGVIDASDAEFFLAETGATKKTASARMAETRGASMAEEIAEKRPGIEGKYKQHIFFGDFKADKKTPTGYHSIKGPSTTHERYGTPSDVATDATIGGVYQQSVRSVADRTKKKEYQSTFFPDDASMDEVLDAITSVYGVSPQPKTVTYPARFKGMKLRKTGETIYPEGTDKYSE